MYLENILSGGFSVVHLGVFFYRGIIPGFGEEALAQVKIGDFFGYINPKDEIIINPLFDDAWDFFK